MQTDFSQYTLEELISKRKNLDPQRQQNEIDDYDDEIDRRYDELENSHRKTNEVIPPNFINVARFICGGFAAWIIATTLFTISDSYFQVKSPLLSELHQYDAVVTNTSCTVGSADLEVMDEFSMLEIDSMGDAFSAIGITDKQCDKISAHLSTATMVTLWHQSGEVFQIDADGHQLLTYEEMNKIRTRLMALDVAPALITIFLFWMFLGKFVIKAVKIALRGQLLDE